MVENSLKAFRQKKPSEEKKNKKRQYAGKQFRNFPKEEKTNSVNMLVKNIELFLKR